MGRGGGRGVALEQVVGAAASGWCHKHSGESAEYPSAAAVRPVGIARGRDLGLGIPEIDDIPQACILEMEFL